MGPAQRAYRKALGLGRCWERPASHPVPGNRNLQGLDRADLPWPQALVLSSFSGLGSYPDPQRWLWPTSQGSPDLGLWAEFT